MFGRVVSRSKDLGRFNLHHRCLGLAGEQDGEFHRHLEAQCGLRN